MPTLPFDLAITLLLALLSIAWWFTTQRRPALDLPRIGPPTVFGYIWTALRFTFDPSVLDEGRRKFAGRSYVVPTLSGPLIVACPEWVEALQHTNDAIFSQPMAIKELLTLDQTQGDHLLVNPYQMSVLRTDMTRAIPSFIPGVYEEISLAMDQMLNPPPGSDSVTIPVLHTSIHLMAWISNRTLVGAPLCRDPKFVHTMVQFAEKVILYSRILRPWPTRFRNTVYSILAFFFGGKMNAVKLVLPVLEEYIRDHDEDGEDTPNTLAKFLVRVAPPEELANPERIALRLMMITFGSIHTSSMFMTNALYELTLLPKEQRDEIREEVQQALAEEGGWNKGTLARFHKLDSLLREIGRVHRLADLGLDRISIQDGTLSDGTFVPAGYCVVADMKRVHMNPDVYLNPEVFDHLRFTKLSDETGSSQTKDSFLTLDKNNVTFGAGRHACPGRFLASMQLKMVLAYILLHYDFTFPDGAMTRPPPLTIDRFVIPNPKGKLIFKRRDVDGVSNGHTQL